MTESTVDPATSDAGKSLGNIVLSTMATYSPPETFYSASSQSYADLSKSLSEYTDTALERARQKKAEMSAAASAVVAAAKASKEAAAAAAAAAIATSATSAAFVDAVADMTPSPIEHSESKMLPEAENESKESSSSDQLEMHISNFEMNTMEEEEGEERMDASEIKEADETKAHDVLDHNNNNSSSSSSNNSLPVDHVQLVQSDAEEKEQDESNKLNNEIPSKEPGEEEETEQPEEKTRVWEELRQEETRVDIIAERPTNESHGDLESVHSKTLTIVIDPEDGGKQKATILLEKDHNEPGVDLSAPCIQSKNDGHPMGSPSAKVDDSSCCVQKSPEVKRTMAECNTLQTLQTRRSLRRVSAIEELMNSEEVYFDYLHILVNHFLSVIKESDCISDEHRQLLSRNGNELFRFQEQFYESLLDAHGDEAKVHNNVVYRGNLANIARCFIEWAPKFEIYNDFCVLHDQALDLYGELIQTNEAFSNMMERLHTFHRVSFGSSNRLQFQDYLIKLLLQQIAKAADKDSEDYELLSQAQDAMHTVTSEIDAKKSILAAERKTKLFLHRLEQDWSLPRRWFDTLGTCTLIGTLEVRCLEYGPKPKRYGCALFQTYMIVAKARKTKTYEPRHWFPIRQFDLENVYDTTEPSMSYGWVLRSDYHTVEFGAMCETEKQLWMDALGKAISRARADHVEHNNNNNGINSDQQGGGNVVEQLFVSSFDRKPLSSQASSIIPSSSSYASFSASRADLLGQPETSERAMTRALTVGAQLCRQDSIGVDTTTTTTTESPTTPASQHPQAHTSGLSSPGRRSNSSIDNLKDYFSANVTEKLSQRKYNHYHHRCMVVDIKFDDVCSTPVMTARAQARNDRASSYEQWRRRANIPKTISMLSFGSHRTLEDLESAVLSSPRNRISTDSIHRYQSFGDALRTVVRRKSSLPSRIRTSESGEDMLHLPVQVSTSTPPSMIREETEPDSIRRGSMIAHLAHPPPMPPPLVQQQSQLHLVSSPPQPESTLKQPVTPSNLARGSSGFFGKMVEKLTSHRSKRK
ncbi:hypothetical protein DFQ30_007482 [Apophysomyces sp. BC1015]|nr:hypothetical protein DFQ30_007482 [Apophysomyces sp. BC1015]KAG0176315.1 hypothetical protein DFQ29_006299 [Apophysomyces sp. BC1021]